jgi:hypothetical protein
MFAADPIAQRRTFAIETIYARLTHPSAMVRGEALPCENKLRSSPSVRPWDKGIGNTFVLA